MTILARVLRFRRPLIILAHLALIPAGYLLAFGLRFEFEVPAAQMERFLITVGILLVIRLAVYAYYRLLAGWWRHVGMHDLLTLVKATTISSVLFIGALFLTGQLAGFSRSVLLLDWALAIMIFGGARFAMRSLREGRLRWGRSLDGPPVVIVGAGTAADRLLRGNGGDGEHAMRPVALVDDDPAKQGTVLHGVRVMGTVDDLSTVVQRTGARQVIIAIPSAERAEMKRVVDAAIETGVEFCIVPSMREMLDGTARLRELRKVQVEDLLGRPPVRLDLAAVERDLEGSVVLVTGAAGSIGAELARQSAAYGPSKLVLVEQAESALYFVDLELRKRHPHLEIVPVVADVTDGARMAAVFAEHRPDHVYHAAAYKHVPLMEANVVEAVRNNVMGTLTVAEAAAAHGARRFLLISTDKAVNPSSVMGATKRVAERLVLGWPSLRRSETDFRAVRFGNVLGSDGSVIPLFRQQLEEGGPLTVTHRDVTRFFMTIPEAVQLVLQAGAVPEAAGRISMLDMGEPVRVVELAENLIRLSGMEPYTEMPIVFTGLRPGEKLFEELMGEVEETVPTQVEKVRVVRSDEPEVGSIQAGVDSLIAAVGAGDRDALVAILCRLVPEGVDPLRAEGRRLAERDADAASERSRRRLAEESIAAS